MADQTHEAMELVERYSAHNYHPLPVVVARAEGVWVTDVEGSGTSTCSPRTPPSTSGTGIPPS